MESGDEYTYAYSLLTPWSRMHSFEGEREGGREGGRQQPHNAESRGREEGARDAEALIRGAGRECRRAGAGGKWS